MEYNFKDIEKKWQKHWDENNTFAAESNSTKKKFYALVEFPYPSAQGLHVGHPRSYSALDAISRKRRLDGENVLFPMGWDAFGLPTENFAIKNNVHPKVVTDNNINNFRRQLKALGLSFDWTREINTTDPNYYKWTQWIFLKFFEKGLAYKKEMPINWCVSCKCGLANEEVVNGTCERCGAEVVQKRKSQWMLKITEYADRLIDDLDEVNYIEKIKTQQKNWIGRSFGAEVDFGLSCGDDKIRVFTTRADTLFGATYMVLSPEHPYIAKYENEIKNMDAVRAYQSEAAKKSDFERAELVKDKTGVKLDGIEAINPATGKAIPIFISDYVLMTYGTGAIMAVPAHDERDWEFAKKFDLPIIEVVGGGNVSEAAFTDIENGTLINSDFLNGLSCKDAIAKMIDWLSEKGLGEKKVNYKLRDWVFSRQRYWGEPIPIVHCEKCGFVPVPYSELPLVLPELDNFSPGPEGESPLNEAHDWLNTTCPKCGGHAERETDTMPQWAGSSWYYLRYADPNNNEEIGSKDALNYWVPVDWYNCGMEHTTLHLLYSRFWHKFLFDLGVVPTKEPYMKRTAHGMILGENGEKMSKSRGNVINPDDLLETDGADSFRTYELFIGAFDQATPWSAQGLKGCHKFLDRVWHLQGMVVGGDDYSKDMEIAMHHTIQKVGDDIEKMKFNTAIAALMTLVNDFYKLGKVNKAELKTFLILLNPFAPHITEEVWEKQGFEKTIAQSSWPSFDQNKTVADEVEIAVQINGKVKGKVLIPRGLDKAKTEEFAFTDESVKALLEGKEIVKVIAVPERIINIVVK